MDRLWVSVKPLNNHVMSAYWDKEFIFDPRINFDLCAGHITNCALEKIALLQLLHCGVNPEIG